MKRLSIVIALNLFMSLIFLQISCKKNTTEPIEKSPFTGICMTDTSGKIIEDDSDDWQPRIVNSSGKFSGPFGVLPAYPNPAGIEFKILEEETKRIGCAITYALPEIAVVTITINDNPDHIIRTLSDSLNYNSGRHLIFWDLKSDLGDLVSNDIYRLFITVETDDSTYTSHGDIEVKK